MRLIDADKAYKVLTEYYHHKTDVQHDALKEAIGKVPSVDAESVVRCKDCKYYVEDINCFVCINGNLDAKPTDYCSWGERRGERREEKMRLVDADKLREDVLAMPNCYNGFSDTYDKAMIVDLIDEQPTVDPVKHGHNTGENVRWFRCSECGWGFNDIFMTDESHINEFPNYCPNCGAKMDEVEDETD